MDYLEVIKKHVSLKELDSFNVSNSKKIFCTKITFGQLYSEFSKLKLIDTNYKKKAGFEKVKITNTGDELLNIFQIWSKNLVPVISENEHVFSRWEIPEHWSNTKVRSWFPLVFFSSGSGGDKKPIVISLYNIIYHYLNVKDQLGLDQNTLYGLNLPTKHLSGLMPIFRSFFAGGSVESFSFNEVNKNKYTHLSIVNSQILKLIESSHLFESLQSVLVGGGKISITLARQALKKNIPLFLTYGLSELTSTVTLRSLKAYPFKNDELTSKYFHLGEALGYCTLKVINKKLVCSGKTCHIGSFINNKYTQSDDSFITSDICKIEDNNLFFLSRSDDVFISGGKNVSINYLSSIIQNCPHISEHHLKILPHSKWGQTYNLFYRPVDNSNYINQNIYNWCREHLKRENSPNKIINLNPYQIKGIKPSEKELLDISKSSKIIFLHGLFGSSDDWTFATKEVENSFSINISLSSKCDSFQSGVYEVKEAIEKLGPGPFHLVGYSMGGRIAYYIMEFFPDLVRSLTLISANYFGIKEQSEKSLRLEKDKMLLNSINSTDDFREFLTDWYEMELFGDYKNTVDYQRKLKNINQTSIQNNKKLLEIFSVGNQPTLNPDSIKKVPIHYIHGDKDKKYRQYAINSPESIQNISIPDTSHACHIENKSIFIRFIKMNLQ